ncbi:sulfur carrier protein ThiS [Alkalicella caledoniensis]|uniref:Sulfur carrier protein ThiS n=1 Tax=Alkalicella caledoniensis TaxID=2731377 RepID=A0A7G9W5R7_ALKCA|nr:sulfur carrier protein ThiS [Alkalicella caledoniensis]QNO14029.1 sulfur carrier protein ThiS [Alkalicella caledoniensis]
MIKVNGRDFQWEEGLTVKGLLEKKKYTFPKIYVRINDELIPQEEYATVEIKDGDDVKVIHMMAGG